MRILTHRLRRMWCAVVGHDYERRDYIGDGSGLDSGIVFCRRCDWAAQEQ
jgi:hypothetical protein